MTRFFALLFLLGANANFAATLHVGAAQAYPTLSAAVAAVQPGDTWHWQLWFRDSSPTGPTSNA